MFIVFWKIGLVFLLFLVSEWFLITNCIIKAETSPSTKTAGILPKQSARKKSFFPLKKITIKYSF